MILQHPESGLYWDDWLIARYAHADIPPLTFEEAVDDLIDQGFIKKEENLVGGVEADARLTAISLQDIKHAVEDSVGRILADPGRTRSPYYTKEEAAAYLRTSVDGIYGRVERGHLKRCQGVRDYLFTKEMLDESVMGRRKRGNHR